MTTEFCIPTLDSIPTHTSLKFLLGMKGDLCSFPLSSISSCSCYKVCYLFAQQSYASAPFRKLTTKRSSLNSCLDQYKKKKSSTFVPPPSVLF